MNSNPKTLRKWKSVEPLPPDWSKWLSPELDGLVRQWQAQRADLENRNEYQIFLERLRREWAIETGVIERLYSIDKAPTMKTSFRKSLRSGKQNMNKRLSL